MVKQNAKLYFMGVVFSSSAFFPDNNRRDWDIAVTLAT